MVSQITSKHTAMQYLPTFTEEGIDAHRDKALPCRSSSLNQTYLGTTNRRAHIQKCLCYFVAEMDYERPL